MELWKRTVAVIGVVLAPATGALGGIIAYDNTVNPTLNNINLGGGQIADDLHMTTGGVLEEFTIEYLNSISTSISVRFWVNDAMNSGPPSTPGLLAEFLSIPISGGGASGTLTVPVVGGPTLPADIWMSVQYSNGGQFNLHRPATVGSSFDSTLINMSGGNFNMNLGANLPFQVVVVPAPGCTALLCLGGLAGLRRRRRV